MHVEIACVDNPDRAVQGPEGFLVSNLSIQPVPQDDQQPRRV